MARERSTIIEESDEFEVKTPNRIRKKVSGATLKNFVASPADRRFTEKVVDGEVILVADTTIETPPTSLRIGVNAHIVDEGGFAGIQNLREDKNAHLVFQEFSQVDGSDGAPVTYRTNRTTYENIPTPAITGIPYQNITISYVDNGNGTGTLSNSANDWTPANFPLNDFVLVAGIDGTQIPYTGIVISATSSTIVTTQLLSLIDGTPLTNQSAGNPTIMGKNDRLVVDGLLSRPFFTQNETLSEPGQEWEIQITVSVDEFLAVLGLPTFFGFVRNATYKVNTPGWYRWTAVEGSGETFRGFFYISESETDQEFLWNLPVPWFLFGDSKPLLTLKYGGNPIDGASGSFDENTTEKAIIYLADDPWGIEGTQKLFLRYQSWVKDRVKLPKNGALLVSFASGSNPYRRISGEAFQKVSSILVPNFDDIVESVTLNAWRSSSTNICNFRIVDTQTLDVYFELLNVSVTNDESQNFNLIRTATPIPDPIEGVRFLSLQLQASEEGSGSLRIGSAYIEYEGR